MREEALLKRLILLAIVLDALLLSSVGAVLLHSRAQSAYRRDVLAKRIGISEEESESSIQEKYALAVGDALRHVTLNYEARAAGGMVELGLSNGEESTLSLSLELVGVESKKTLAATALVDPGWCVDSVPLQLPLAKGRCRALARFTFYTVEEAVPVGTAVKQVLLRVE